MGLSAPLTTATINEGLSLLAAMADPQTAKRVLNDLSNQIATLNEARDEATAMQQAAQKDRADADRALADRAAALNSREADLTAREAAFAVRHAEYERFRASARNYLSSNAA